MLRGEASNSGSTFVDVNLLERVVLLGAEGRFTQATLVQGSDASGQTVSQQALTVQSTNSGKRLIIRKPDVRISSAFEIKLH